MFHLLAVAASVFPIVDQDYLFEAIPGRKVAGLLTASAAAALMVFISDSGAVLYIGVALLMVCLAIGVVKLAVALVTASDSE